MHDYDNKFARMHARFSTVDLYHAFKLQYLDCRSGCIAAAMGDTNCVDTCVSYNARNLSEAMNCFVIKIMSECRVEDVKEYVHLECVLDLVEIDVELNAMSVYTIITGTHY